jgi:signal transduction histidine kinase/CheY-like chemotaxis protein
MGLMCVLYLFNVLASARQVSRVLDESIRLRLEKQELVQQLQEEKSAAEKARTSAEEANVAKSKFLAAASHDLRQPLHAVNLFVDALRHAPDKERADEILAHLGASALSLEELLNELLDISKLEAGLFKPEVCVLDLQEIFDGMERELRPLADEKGIELGFVATRLKVRSDPLMLGRILRNIITNAIRYTTRGAVLVGCRRREGSVAIAVYDTGPGIPPEYHQAIFREFYQLGNPERDRRKGLGLGLAIVDGLCRILGHSLSLRSTLGRGSAFFVQVPIARQEVSAPIAVREECPGSLQGWSVLIIDDEPTICQAMEGILAHWGCRVLSAESAREALLRLNQENFAPDAIVVDYRLREGLTGSEAISEIRNAIGRHIPALIVTGDTAPERLREANASGYLLLHKPVQPARLRTALARLRGGAPGDVESVPEEKLKPVAARVEVVSMVS